MAARVLGFVALLALSLGCKAKHSDSEAKEIDSTEPSTLNGAKIWTIHCADNWTNSDGTSRVTITDPEYRALFQAGADIDKTYCNIKGTTAGSTGGNGGGGTNTGGGGTNTGGSNTGTAGGFGLNDCTGEFPLARQLAYVVDQQVVTDIDMLCLGFIDPFEKMLASFPEFATFLIKSRSQPAKIFLTAEGSEIQYKDTLHRVFVPWNLDAATKAKLESKFAPFITVVVTSDGTQTKPGCSWGSTCTFTGTGKDICAKALCNASGFSQAEFVSASNDPCNSAKFNGPIFWADMVSGQVKNLDVGNDSAVTAKCRK